MSLSKVTESAGPVATPLEGKASWVREAAEPCLADSAEVRAEEAEMIRTPVGGAGITHVHRRTGRAWRGTLEDGKPVRERVSERSG